jgi:protein kinase-like protein
VADSGKPITGDPSADTAVVLDHIAAEGLSVVPADDLVIGHEIGRGGMGVIHSATQTALARRVAAKRLRPEAAAQRGPFLSEAHVFGRLEHPNVVPVYGLRAGPDGEPVCVMKLVDGKSWSELLHDSEPGLELAEHLRILLAVCNGIAFAHDRRILHRDIKPANVMVGDFGQVYVMDWGLAVAMDEAACEGTAIVHRAQADTPAGTPGYMAPELARGDGLAQDQRTDVYLLGACLHEVLVRRRRHEGDSTRSVLEAAIRSAPFSYGDEVPAELAAICNRATAADPAERHPAVTVLRAAIEAYLDHRQAQTLVDDATLQVAELEREVAGWDGSEEAAAGIHRANADLRATLEHALKLWPEAPVAKAHVRRTGELMKELEARSERRRRELESLRETARMRDWSTIAAPIGTAFVIAGLLGAVGVAVTRLLFSAGFTRYVFLVWLSVAALCGLAAFKLLRGRSVPENLVSPRMIGLWAAVALGCVVNGAQSTLQGRVAFYNAADESQIVGLGFAAMAMQTRRWLLWPAAAFMLGSFAMGPGYPYNVEMFGAIWLLTMIGVGIALKRGARLTDPAEDAPAPSRPAKR